MTQPEMKESPSARPPVSGEPSTGDEERVSSLPDTVEGRQLVGDYYAHNDARKGIGLSFGQRLRKVEVEARATPPSLDVERLRQAMVNLHRERAFTLAEGAPLGADAIATEYARLTSKEER